MPRPLPAPKGKLAPLLSKRAEELGVSMKQIADVTERHLNHVRRVMIGTNPPSDGMLEKMAKLLKMNLEEVKNLRAEDQLMRSRFGQRVQSATLGIPPSLIKLADVWVTLSSADQARAAAMIRALAETAQARK